MKHSETKRGLGTIKVEQFDPKVILSKENKKICTEKLKLFNLSQKLDQSKNEAAVLVPLCLHNGQLGFLYTLRSTKMTKNRGQVSFPGGMRDKDDVDLKETALRETWEELKIPKEKVDVWTTCNIIGRNEVNIMPVLGYIGEINLDTIKINPYEVEQVFVLPLPSLCDPSTFRFTQFRTGYTLPVYLSGDYRIWGLTAVITHMILTAMIPDFYKNKISYMKPILKRSKTSN
ncbi:mitochondrial coenzyme A diphosphatase NUDT8 isoform X2 [Prorops nasuta]|uniref:mitochondrial coenzyme A diphosphatase NUDT8 isoform X2 n=1 Tax=Prorops nasuta TaxID=863751 RepID=UPI0034CD08DA